MLPERIIWFVAALTVVQALSVWPYQSAAHPLVLTLRTSAATPTSEDWITRIHEPGYCAMYDYCGHRDDKDVLSCPANIQAQSLDQSGITKLRAVCPQLASEVGPDGRVCCTEQQLDQIQKQIQIANAFLVGCPACNHNFKHMFCLLTCSPDQATFTNVTQVQVANDTRAIAVKEVDIFVSSSFGNDLYNSCKDVIFAALNQKAMIFVGGGAQNYQEWFDFLGLVKDKRMPPTGSPFQMNFPPEDQTPDEMHALEDHIASCADAPLACSCGDCPAASRCTPIPPPPSPSSNTCSWLPFPGATCIDISLFFLYLALLACLPAVVRHTTTKQEAENTRGRGVMESGLYDSLLREDDEDPSCSKDKGKTAAMNEVTYEAIGDRGSGDFLEYPFAEHVLRRSYCMLGLVCCKRPWRTIAVCAAVLLGCMLGLLRLHVIREPLDLWVAPGSQAALDKARYEAAFGPFYRITQLIVSTTTPGLNTSSSTTTGIVSDANIQLMFDMQAAVDSLSVAFSPTHKASGGGGGESSGNISLIDVCFKPIGGVCATQSVLQYWAMDKQTYSSRAASPAYCFSHWSTACRAQNGAPTDPHLVLGGFSTNASTPVDYVSDATSFIVTYPLSSHADTKEAAEAWEKAFIELAQGTLKRMAEPMGLRVSFSTERSVKDELNREGGADIMTVVGSYMAMLVYIALALGSFKRGSSLKDIFVQSRASLALGGVTVVATAVGAALGVCGWLGIGATLIIAEVIPFIALAIGTDNMFLLVQALDNIAAGGGGGVGLSASAPYQQVAVGLAAAGPSITLAASCQVLSFALGMLVSMPALRNFAVCAALALGIDFLLQITVFPAMLTLDMQRRLEGRYDVAPWIVAYPANRTWNEEDENDSNDVPYNGVDEGPAGTSSGWNNNSTAVAGSSMQAVAAEWGPSYIISTEPNTVFASTIESQQDQDGHWGVAPALKWCMSRQATLLSKPVVKAVVLAIFGGLFLFSCGAATRLQMGLDQRIALPSDSYLQNYFTDVATQLRVGPPVMFIVSNMSLSENLPDVSQVCSVAPCAPDSLLNLISNAARVSWASKLATPAASWLDDFISWIDPEVPQCCRMFPNGTFCPPPDQWPCAESEDTCKECSTCLPAGEHSSSELPNQATFQALLPMFMGASPSAACPKGGAGVYTDALQTIKRDGDNLTTIAGLSEGVIVASSFRSNNVALSSQRDFIEALQASRQLVDEASATLNLTMYTYSIFHPFFEQYLSLGGETVMVLGSAAVAVFLICLLATGSAGAAGIILFVLFMLIVDLVGTMVLSGAQLNAVSLVNLAAACGIGVEFCVHIMHAYMEAKGSSEERAASALCNVGPAVLSGITLTKIVGVAVLAAAKTTIFKLYYFKFYLSLVVLGAAHGLWLLPVLLSILGPEGFSHWKWIH